MVVFSIERAHFISQTRNVLRLSFDSEGEFKILQITGEWRSRC